MAVTNALTARVIGMISWTYEKTESLTGRVIRDKNEHKDDTSITDGQGADQAELLYAASRTATTATPDDLDLAGGLSNAFGETLTFTTVKAVCISNTHATGVLTVGGGSNPWDTWLGAAGDAVVVPPGGVLLIRSGTAAGFAVTASTADILRVSASGADTTYDIVILGH